jgi:uncharacterized protein involved in exopolysaccharide biosynthesis
MSNRTISERIEELEADRTRLREALAKLQSGSQSSSIDGMSRTNYQIKDMRHELTRVEKSLQRLYRGGRGISIDMSY